MTSALLLLRPGSDMSRHQQHQRSACEYEEGLQGRDQWGRVLRSGRDVDRFPSTIVLGSFVDRFLSTTVHGSIIHSHQEV